MSVPTRKLNRRTALSLAGGAALGAAVGPGFAGAARAAGRQRVVIVGGGVAGVSLAWLLDGAHDVTLLEAEPRLGGHARTLDVPVGGRVVPVDAGAQYFGPKSHPIYWKLLTDVLKVPTIPAPMNLTVNRYGRTQPMLVSPDNRRVWPLFDPRYWGALVALAAFVEQGRQLEARDDWTTTAADFIDRLPLLGSVRDEVLYPLAGAMFGFSVPEVKQMSARAVVAFVVRGLGDGFLAPYDYHNAAGGLGAVVSALHTGLTTVDTRVGAAATRLERTGATWRVTDATGAAHEADHVVLALPPYAAGPLVAQLAGGQGVADVYARFRYLPARIAIHTDPAFMPKDRGVWSGFNVLHDGQFCEPTMWFGAFRPGVDVFKSWVSHRREQPRDVLATIDYRHAHETPDYARAQRLLGQRQGEQNLWFAGTHMTDVSSQESALLSAMRVAEKLAPASPALARLR
ncbi:FAD-dependent oxidoreductase [Spirilliplanes yamanashiensis]|uniref:FAD-dependent oxidoreductase n=1 Tax=Spirilliplanes yamanashiensis TaxID=42233 RepID=A0A8J4DM11_9ACTN|nr:FAD-dependent oxidoreductase [Spirilliplanes yamanashiensis]MDP9816426.1 putative NAD/FAD-binding protein [Spirilliplanes yamanashiensis]GIJ05953.1 FAD-dependent oxidoreductase [Spirilliplanes yamanashiensis]